MNNLARTTITLPAQLLKKAKIRAVEENKNLSLLIREILQERLPEDKGREVVKKMPPLGKYKLGIKEKFSRKEIYGAYLKRKISS